MTAALPLGSIESAALVEKPFGAENRDRLIQKYFLEMGEPVHGEVWKHIYRLLLWVDQTIGLAHCYESDKSQPGRPWYGRSLAFHAWLATQLQVPAARLGEHIDWMFRQAVADLTQIVLNQESRRAEASAKQRAPFASLGMPLPGEDPELTQIIRELLGPHLPPGVSEETWRQVVQRIRQHMGLENKRKNLVGEGFEDVIAAMLKHVLDAGRFDVSTRSLLHDLPGFNRNREGDKPNKVDVAVKDRVSGMRTLVTAKWSVRADREKQFATDFHDYVDAESGRKAFRYVLVTNEFDPARLMRACESLAMNAPMFAHVVHINTDGVRATYGTSTEASAKKVLGYIDSGRLIGFDRWVELLPEN